MFSLSCLLTFPTLFLRSRARESGPTDRKLLGCHCAVLVGTVFIASPAYANENAYFEDLPTVLTVSRLPQPLNEAPGAVTVIEGDFIRATGYRDLARVFRLVPGMQVGQERGNASWVTYHGHGNNFSGEGQLQVLIDGRSVYAAGNYGGVSWATLPLAIEEIERIEIVRGPNAVTYGANAFSGVINIITRHSGQAPSWRVATNQGGSGISDALIAGGAVHESISWRATATRVRDNGFDNLNDYKRGWQGSLRTDYRLSTQDELMLRVAGSSMRWGEGYPLSFIEANEERELRSENSTFHIKWTRAPAPEKEFIAQYYRIKERVREFWTPHLTPPLVPIDISIPFDRTRTTVRDHLELQSRFQSSDSTRLVFGVEGLREELDSVSIFANGSPSATYLVRAFTNLEWQADERWRANLGAAYERYSDESGRLAPRAFVNWQLDSANTLRFGYSRAYEQRRTIERDADVQLRDPSNGTLLLHYFMPNPSLARARMDAAEISYLGRFRPWHTVLDVRLFNERTSGLPVLRPVASSLPSAIGHLVPSNQSFNSSRHAVSRGVEYQVKTRPWESGEWILSHAIINRKGADEDSVMQGAPYSASLSWLQKWGAGWTTALTAFRVGPMSGPVHYAPAYQYSARAYTAYDFRIAYAKNIGSRKAEFALNAINLGKRHQEQPDRSVQDYLGSLGDHEPANRVSPMVYLSVSMDL